MKKSWIIYLCIVLSIALVVIALGSKLFLDWMSIEIVKLQTLEAEYSWVNKKPLKVELQSKENLLQSIEASGIKLTLPWDDMDLFKKESDLYTFQSEEFYIVITRKQDLLSEDVTNTIINKKKITPFYNSLAENYGQQVISSHYEFDKIILNITQEDLKKGYFNKKLDMLCILINLKCQLIPNTAQTGIYCFEKGLIKGFQFGTENKIMLWVYNNKDEKYQISISRKTDANTKISKSVIDEVNAILPTIEFVNE